MVGRLAFQPNAQKVAQRQGVSGAPRDPALRIEAIKVTNQQQPEIDAGRQTRSAHGLGVELRALGFDKVVEAMLAQQLIQAAIERMPRGRR